MMEYSVNAFLKDSKGFIWMGTFEGLMKYDGYEITYLLNGQPPFPELNGYVNTLAESEDGHILVGTISNGLFVYDPVHDSFRNYSHSKTDTNTISDNCILDIHVDHNGNIWIGTKNGLDLFDIREGTSKRYRKFKGKEGTVISIVNGDKGDIWLYEGNGVCLWNTQKKQCEKYIHISENKKFTMHDPVALMAEMVYDPNEKVLWIGSKEEGLIKCYIEQNFCEKFFSQKGPLKDKYIESLLIDSNKRLWIGTEGYGLFHYDRSKEGFEMYSKQEGVENSISGNSILSLYESDPGILWLGVFAGGVDLMLERSKRKFHNYLLENDYRKKLKSHSVLSITENKEGEMFAGTDGGGLYTINNPNHKLVRKLDNACFDVVRSIHYGQDNKLWMGGYRDGLCILNTENQQSEHFLPSDSLIGNTISGGNVWEITETSDDKVWLGLLNGGVNVYDKKTASFSYLSLKTTEEDTREFTVYSILESFTGDIWIGTEDNGVFIYENSSKKVVPFSLSNNGIEILTVKDIYQSEDSLIWFSTTGHGIGRLSLKNEPSLQFFNTEHGLSSNHIQGMLEDANGNLWIATEYGLTFFDRAKQTFHVFNEEDGIQSTFFINGSQFKSQDGTMYFGNLKGMLAFHPDSILINTRAPEVVITDFKIFNRSVEDSISFRGYNPLNKSIVYADTVFVEYEDNVFSFEFAALDYSAPTKNKYAYMLKGFDEQWTYVDADKRFATYTNLDPGTYKFRVIASNNDNIWNMKGADITVVISPPWWMIWWVKASFILFIISMVTIAVVLRIKRIKKQKKILEQLVKRRTNQLEVLNTDLIQANDTKDKLISIVAHDLKNPITSLSTLGQTLKIKNRFDQHIINNMLISAQGASNLVDNLLGWVRVQDGKLNAHPEEINLSQLIQLTVELYSSQREVMDVALKVEIDPTHFIKTDPHMIATVFRNILNNAIKFSPKKGEVVISSEYNVVDQTISISFKDHGNGISQENIGKILSGEKADISTGRNNQKGLGLGLTISREFIKTNHGKLSIKSEESRGTTFIVTIPGVISNESRIESTRQHQEEKLFESTATIEESIKSEFKGNKVLIVDDDAHLRKSIQLLLSEIFEVYEAADGNEAEKIALEIMPDLIISDIMMPVKDGVLFCKAIKSNIETSHIPVILITAETSEEKELEGLVAGADDYITKPFSAEKLLVKMNNLFSILANMRKHFAINAEIQVSNTKTAFSVDEEILHKATKFILVHLDNSELNGDMLCHELGLSKSVLYAKLKNFTGQTVNEFIRTIRLKSSIPLLLDERNNISQVAVMVGFNSASYYTRSFHDLFGESPKEYISKHK